MSAILRITFLFCALCICSSLSTPAPEKAKDEPSDSTEEESGENVDVTISPAEKEKLMLKIMKNQEENAEKFGLPLTSKPEELETFLEKEGKLYGQDLPDKIDKELAETESDDDFKNLMHFLELFDKIESAASEKEEEVVNKTSAEMKELKEEIFRLTNELNRKRGAEEVSHEEFNKVWNKRKKEYGKYFPGRAEKLAVLLKKTLDEMETTTAETTSEVSEAITSTQSGVIKEELPKGVFSIRNTEGEICILANFQSAITITYAGKTSEQKVEVTIPENAHTKGKCRGPNGSALLHITWGKFIFSLIFNQTTEDTWAVTLVELTFDTSGKIFDGAAEREKVTVKSKQLSLFETPYGKSYFCPAQEVILLYHEDKQVATVRLKEIHLQPYDVEDGKFSSIHRCNQVVIGGPDEEPFVQDETVPLAVGCTLALITLLILVGFSVHRAYHAAKVDYNTME